MNLDNFENYIEKVICLRGHAYYEGGHVAFIKEAEENVYVAEVEGTEIYTVYVEHDKNLNILETQCDCPYDMGEYCKHQVAVLLALRDIKNNEHAKRDSTDKESVFKEPEKKRLSIKKKELDIEEIISARTKEELVNFLLGFAFENDEVRQRISLEFDDEDDKGKMLEAVSLIRTYIRNNSDRHGFVDYEDAYSAVQGAELVLAKAESAFEKNEIVYAVNLALCSVGEMVDLLENADDSGGTISGVVEWGLGFIDKSIEKSVLSLSEKSIIFETLMKEASHIRYDGWTDWKLDFLRICSRISGAPGLRNRLEECLTLLERKNFDSWSSKYFSEKISQIKYNIILQNDGEKEAQNFMEQNLHFSSFRKMSIEKAMKEEAYEEVIMLAIDGEAKDKGWLNLVSDWRGYRYKAYKLSGKLEDQRRVAMDFILDGSFDYYIELKSTYDINEWIDVYPKIILLLENQKSIHPYIYPCILIEERERGKLLEYVKKSPSSIEMYYKHLISDYRENVYDLFLKHIEDAASRATNRRDYQRVCAIIKKLHKLGAKDQALDIKQKLFIKYDRKPAFKDELAKVLNNNLMNLEDKYSK